MRVSALVALATVAIGQVAALSVHHNHALMHRAVHATAGAVEKRSTEPLDKKHHDRLTRMGFTSAGENACENNGKVWIGNDGPYTNTFHNHAGEPIILVIWGPDASWVNQQQPLITVALGKGDSKTISFNTDQTGAWAAIYEHTKLVNGQVSQTWGEYTFNNWGVVDVSREVNMDGHHMRIEGPTCVSDFDRCVFTCPSGTSCMTGYTLDNCNPADNPGAQYGTYDGAPSGGCGGLGDKAHLNTFFGHRKGFIN